jgi:hypothetical protein
LSLENALAENTAALAKLSALMASMFARDQGLPLAALPATASPEPAPAAQAPGKPSAATTARSKPTAEAAPSQPALSAAAPAPSPEATPPAAAAPSAPAPVTYEQVAKAITEAVKTRRDAVVAALKQFGAARGVELKPEQFADFLKVLG